MLLEQTKAFQKLPKGLLCDPHDRRPFALAWFFVNPQHHLVFTNEWPNEPFVRIKTCSKGVKDYVELIRGIEKGDNQLGLPLENVVWRIMDPSFGKTKSAVSGRTLQQDFAMEGMWFDCTVDNTIEAGHLAVKERLRDPPQLFCTPHCQNIIDAMLHYRHAEFKRQEAFRVNEKPSEDYKDFADLVRYAVMFNPTYFTTDIPPTEGLSGMGIE